MFVLVLMKNLLSLLVIFCAVIWIFGLINLRWHDCRSNNECLQSVISSYKISSISICYFAEINMVIFDRWKLIGHHWQLKFSQISMLKYTILNINSNLKYKSQIYIYHISIHSHLNKFSCKKEWYNMFLKNAVFGVWMNLSFLETQNINLISAGHSRK